MALGEIDQIRRAIQHSQQPLLVLPEMTNPDAASAALGLGLALQKIKKPICLVCAQPLPDVLDRISLPHPAVNLNIPEGQSLIIELDTKQVRLSEMRREPSENTVRLICLPESGAWQPSDVRVSLPPLPYDLILVIGAHDLESCGPIHADHKIFFEQTPIINLDHSPANEHFGHLNFVDMTAASVSEVCYRFIQSAFGETLDETIATWLLTGLIFKTRGFRTVNVTARTLEAAGALIDAGGRHEEVITALYRARTVPTLRLWGRALARLKYKTESRIVWTLLSRQDFLHAGSTDDDLSGVLDELLSSTKEAELALLLYESAAGDDIHGILRVHPPHQAASFLKPFSPTGSHEQAIVKLMGMNLIQAEQKILDHLISILPPPLLRS